MANQTAQTVTKGSGPWAAGTMEAGGWREQRRPRVGEPAKAATENAKRWRFRSAVEDESLPERIRLIYVFRLERACGPELRCGTRFVYEAPGRVTVCGR